MKEILTGSKAFFSDIKDFVPHDTDVIHIGDEIGGINDIYFQCGYPKTIFYYPMMDKSVLLNFISSLNPINAACIGIVLIKEVNEVYGITIDDLKKIKSYCIIS